MNDTGPSTGQFLVTHKMEVDASLADLMAFQVALALRAEQLRGYVELTYEKTPIGTLYQWRPVI